MRKWILLGLLGLLLWYILTQREGYQDSPSIKSTYSVPGDAKHVISLMPASLLAAIKKTLPKQPCPGTTTPPAAASAGADVHAGSGGGIVGLLDCEVDETTDSGAVQIVSGDISNVMGAFYTRVYQPANAPILRRQVDDYLATYPMTPFLTANQVDIKTLLVAYFVSQSPGEVNKPLTEREQIAANAATVRGYNAMEIPVTNNGPLEAAIDEKKTPGEKPSTRPADGPVFDVNGPFSGNAGTSQGTGMNAASTLTGSSYAHPPPTEGRLDPYDLWPGTKGTITSAPPATKMFVKGPSWGGMGQQLATTGSQSSSPAAALYGPTQGGRPNGWGYSQKNGVDTSGMPSYLTSGSDPSNQYAATSRAPGDQDLFPDTNLQASSYSLANGAQKTDPVPFLTDFSAFQN